MNFISLKALSIALLPPLNLLLLGLLGLLALFFRRRTRLALLLTSLAGLLLPILVSGGSPFATRTSEAAQMKAAVNLDFRTDVKWLDETSSNTFESARYARQQLAGARIDRIELVTHAIHMPRARPVFEQAGFRVIEAPTGFSTLRPPGILNYLPSSEELQLSRAVLYEVIGLGWYHGRLAAGGQRGQQ